MALPLGELSPKVTERALHPGFPSPSSLRSATSPKGRGKGDARHFSCRGTPPLALPLGELSPQVTERALHPGFPSPSSLRSATSPKGRGKGDARHFSCRGTPPWLSLWESCRRRRLRGYCTPVSPLRPRCARPPLPKGEARGAYKKQTQQGILLCLLTACDGAYDA